jgi:hypothetical protein
LNSIFETDGTRGGLTVYSEKLSADDTRGRLLISIEPFDAGIIELSPESSLELASALYRWALGLSLKLE